LTPHHNIQDLIYLAFTAVPIKIGQINGPFLRGIVISDPYYQNIIVKYGCSIIIIIYMVII